MKFHSLKRRFEPYQDVIIFMVTLLVANYFWKFTMVGDEDGEIVTWFGLDVTAPFAYMVNHITSVVYWLISLFRDSAYRVGDHIIRFKTGTGTSIIWGCSGLKQSFIWLCLILTVQGGWKHKLWFIPFGWICCFVFNVLRIFLIALLTEHHREWFYFLHDGLFKYAFYAMMFGLWLWFVEKWKD